MDLFVYGALMEPEVAERVLGRVPRSAPARLFGYRRVAMKRRRYPGLVPARGAETEGLLFLDLEKGEIRLLDRFERAEYRRKRVMVLQGNRKVRALVYVCSRAGKALALRKTLWDPETFRKRIGRFLREEGLG